MSPLVVFQTPPVEPTYATLDELRAYAPELASTPDSECIAALLKAERDIDWYAGFGGAPDETTGLRFIPADLGVGIASALSRATCAQAQYRLYMGPVFFIEQSQYTEVGGEIGTSRPRRIGPETKLEFPAGMGKYTGRLT